MQISISFHCKQCTIQHFGLQQFKSRQSLVTCWITGTMKSQEPRAGGRVCVKESIKYVCELLTSLGVTPHMTPEALRLAKFNISHSPQHLLHALHDIVTLSIAVNPHSQALDDDDEIFRFVSFHLALWGYPPHSPFFTHCQSSTSSRHLLLALGWMISHCQLIAKGLDRRLQPLLAARTAAPLPDDYPLDIASSPEALALARESECAARDYVRRMIATATDRVEGEVEMRADQVLILYGQVRACLNAIEALQQSKVKKLHELELAQLAAGVKHPHSPYELLLLQHRKKLDVHCQAIAAAKEIEEETEACRKHEALFWQWMESVVHEELSNPKSPVQPLDITGVTEAELLPAIDHLKLTLATCEQNDKNQTSSSCRNGEVEMPTKTLPTDGFKRTVDVCSGEESIAEGLLRPPVFVYRPKKGPDTRTIKASVRNEGENDPQSALFKIKRLREVDEMVRGILARTQAENKAVIMEIMKPIMEDESYVVVGL